jgi:ribosomal peptide maturation radical SAM protein 1
MSPDQLRHVRNTIVPQYLDEMMAAADWGRYRVVGFTSTFQQNAASFALARRLKSAYPRVVTLFGGANFDGPMGAALMEAVPAIDLAISGEADRAFPAVLQRLCHGGDPLTVPGVIGRVDGRVVPGPPGIPLDDLDALPIPDYSEFFERAESLGLLPRSSARAVDIPFESSRGCWWGEKATCRFCGLNGSTMTYRAKSPQRVLNELETLALRHRSLAFNASDNILDVEYLRTVMAPLAASDSNYWIFYEVKANLGRHDVHLLQRAGVAALQPGIESLSTHILRLMQKGTTAIQNVNLLRWAQYYGIATHWNILLGFPGETEADYEQQTRLAGQLVHLGAPGGFVRIGLERFSPYFENPDVFRVRGGGARPEAGYTHTYPASVDLDRAAYHFAGELEGSLTDEAYEPLLRVVRAWHDRWHQGQPPSLTFWWSPGQLHVEDRRNALTAGTYQFEDPFAAMYVACSDQPVNASVVRSRLRLDASDFDVEAALDEFCRCGLMMRDGANFLALALPATRGR